MCCEGSGSFSQPYAAIEPVDDGIHELAQATDLTLMDFSKDLQTSNVKHVNIMGLLSKMHIGRGNLPFHDKDILSM